MNFEFFTLIVTTLIGNEKKAKASKETADSEEEGSTAGYVRLDEDLRKENVNFFNSWNSSSGIGFDCVLYVPAVL